MKFLIYPPISEENLAQLRSVAAGAEIVNAQDEATARTHIGDADGMYGTLTPALLAAARKLRWLQAPVAGVERYLFPELANSEITVTNMAGIYSDQIADHAIMFLLMFARGMNIYFRRQLERRWQSGVPVIHVADQTLGVVGLGGIGSEVARRGHALGMRVLAVDAMPKAKPDSVEELWTIEKLDDLLAAADFVVSCVPHTPETVKLFTLARLQRMKPSAYLINISRGVVVDLADLTTALQSGVIAGAALDVFEIEPLPAGHPLWSMENVLITPHMAANIDSPHIPARRIGVVRENLRRFVSGEPLRNIIDKSRWF
jgi:phosphoglycerate dehydrogenase-like enzyme